MAEAPRERWAGIERLVDQTLDLPPADRAAFLERACAGDPELRAEVERLVGAAEAVGTFLEEPAPAYAAPLLARLAEGSAPAPGARLGSYEIVRELGRGGMATVWLAEERHPRRHVALKVLRPEIAQALGPERFLREVDLAAKLTHPHILPIHAAGEAAGLLYYAMPYVEGESLRDRLNREKQLPLDDALQIAREVADALSYAHQHDVVHRDIKPENILLEAGHAVVADFGIARAITAAGGERLTPETGIAVGTPAYMSPEQAAASKELDGRSDLYSLGCVLYEMLAGRPPFVGPTADSVLHQHLTADAPSITTMRPAVPAEVAAALARALAKTPADRFNPVALFAEALAPRASAAVATPPPGRVVPLPTGRAWQRQAVLGIGLVIVIAGAVALDRLLGPGGAESRSPRTAIAVLPFQNLSAEGPHAYFAGGLHDELLTQLSKVAALSVRGRTSVMGYASTTKPMAQIADELAVGTIIEASVQVVGDRLRVNVQLIDMANNQSLWAETYKRTLDDAFAIQSDIAQQVVAAVGATLGGTERASIDAAPTANGEAYRLYLQGLEYFHRPGFLQGNWEIAQDCYERALALDSTFALAYAALSGIHGFMWWWRYDPSPSRLARQQQAAEMALRLAPDLPQAHQAMGWAHYHGHRDWQAALQEYRIALAGLPNDAELWWDVGAVHRRLGNWDEVVAAFDTAVRLDPRHADILGDLGARSLHVLRRYREAVEWYSRSLALAPDVGEVDVLRGWAWVAWQGWLDSLRVALDRHRADADLVTSRARLLIMQRSPDSLLALLRRTPRMVFDEHQIAYLPATLYAAWAHQLRGDGSAARTAFDSARVLLDSVILVLPDDWRMHVARGLAFAGMGRHQEAQREARWLQQSKVYRADAYMRPVLTEGRAWILVGIDEAGAALQEIERLLAGPSWVSAHTLRLDPRWDPIRDDPRFQALLVKYANPEAVR